MGRKVAKVGEDAGGRGLLQLEGPGIARLVTQGLQGTGKALQEGGGEFRRELAPPLGDGAGPHMLVAQPREAAEKAVLPEPAAADRLLVGIEAEERHDALPGDELRVLPEVLVAGFEAVGAAVAPRLHVAQRARARIVHFEEVLREL